MLIHDAKCDRGSIARLTSCGLNEPLLVLMNNLYGLVPSAPDPTYGTAPNAIPDPREVDLFTFATPPAPAVVPMIGS